MPSIVRHPATNTPGIQFGVAPRPAMSTRSKNSSANGNCRECTRKRKAGHRHARDAKWCKDHQCPVVDTSGEMCTRSKKDTETRCSTHTECKASSCHKPRTLDERNIPNEYCTIHTCVVMDCNEGRVYDPSQGAYDSLCASHVLEVCTVPSCPAWKYENGNYCKQHTCTFITCDKKSISDARPFCTTHDVCNIQGCPKPRFQLGSDFELVCREHYIAPCAIESCRKKSSPPNKHCDLLTEPDSCRYTRCKKEARPGLGRPFCIDHKCTDHDCQFPKSFSEEDGSLKMNSFCLRHECESVRCEKHIIPDKPYCNSHCCTKQGCAESREPHPKFGTLCSTHYEERIEENAAARLLERLGREKAQREATARAEATARTEAARRQAQRQEGDLRERERRQQALRQEEELRERERRQQAQRQEEELRERARRQQAAYAESRQGRPASSSRDRQYQGNSGIRYAEDDEGYRSHRSSGERFSVDGW